MYMKHDISLVGSLEKNTLDYGDDMTILIKKGIWRLYNAFSFKLLWQYTKCNKKIELRIRKELEKFALNNDIFHDGKF